MIAYLERVDPPAAERARERYACFEHFGGEQAYGRAASLGISESCRQGVVAQLTELQRLGDAYLRRDGIAAEDEQFYAEQNARLVASAEEYYRSMFGDPASSWNLRDRHMADTLDRLAHHLGRHGEPPRIVVWEHNSHVGDARHDRDERAAASSTSASWRASAGPTTSPWSASPPTPGPSPRPRPGTRRPSASGCGRRCRRASRRSSTSSASPASSSTWSAARRRRRSSSRGWSGRSASSTGPRPSAPSHYFFAHLAGQFDAVVHIDETRAVEPLERTAGWEVGEPPETYPERRSEEAGRWA